MSKQIPLSCVRRSIKASQSEIIEFRSYRYGLSRWALLQTLMLLGSYPSSVAVSKS